VQQHVGTFLAQAEAETGAFLPQFVKDGLDAFLELGILAHGFLRLRCCDFGRGNRVAFNFMGRGLRPSCGRWSCCVTREALRLLCRSRGTARGERSACSSAGAAVS
jgi:hypothetical protein